MNNYLFTTHEGLILIQLLIAHFLADFLLQSTAMVKNKKWFTRPMAYHMFIVFACTYALSQLFLVSLIITIGHWITDSLKISLQTKIKESVLFFSDQAMHLLIIVATWFVHFDHLDSIAKTLYYPFTEFHTSLVLLAYLWVIFPVGYLIRYGVKTIISHKTLEDVEDKTRVEHGGRLIGIFERIIILTFVLLNQYEAIGFLITGKSIIRFADHNSNLKSEYVLVGTMMSYAIAIVTGVLTNWFIAGAR